MSRSPMDRARVVAAMVDQGAVDGSTRPVEGLRAASGLPWQDFDQAALELARAGAVALVWGESLYPVVGPHGEAYASAGLALTIADKCPAPDECPRTSVRLNNRWRAPNPACRASKR